MTLPNTVTGRQFIIYQEDQTAFVLPAGTANPEVEVCGGIHEVTLPTYADKQAVALHFDSRGRLMVDTELTIDGATFNIDNVFTFSSDKLASGAGYGLIDAVTGNVQVDVITLPGGLTGYAEDVLHQTGDLGIMSLVVRSDVLATLSADNQTGDYTPLQVNAKGSLYTDLSSILGSDMSATNPVFAELTDGANVIAAGNPLNIQVGDGTDQTKVHKANDLVIDNIAGYGGLQTASLLYGYDDTFGAETWRVLAIDANGRPEVDIIAQSLTALKISKDANANATANRLWTKANVDQIAGTATAVDSGATNAGTQRFILATDDPAVTALEIIDDWDAVHGAAIGSDGVSVMFQARSTQLAAVAQDQAAHGVTNLNSEIVIAGTTWATNSIRCTEIASLDTKASLVSLVDTTNIPMGDNEYPSATGKAMLPYTHLSLTGKLIAAAGETLTLTVLATNDEDLVAGDWHDITMSGYRTDNNTTGNVSITVTGAGPEKFAIDFDNLNYDYYYVNINSTDVAPANTVIVKERRRVV